MRIPEPIPYGQDEEIVQATINRIASGHPQANAGAYADAETLNVNKSDFSYGHGDCVTMELVHPESPYRAIGEVAIGDDKGLTPSGGGFAMSESMGFIPTDTGESLGTDNRILPVTRKMAKMLVAYVSQPGAIIPGVDTESELDQFHSAKPSDGAAWEAVLEKSDELGVYRFGYDVEVGNEPEDTFLDWVRTGETEDDDCIMLGAVNPASSLRIIGCTAMIDSRYPTSTVLIYDASEMARFVEGARNGDFDDPGAPSTHPDARGGRIEGAWYEPANGLPRMEYIDLEPGIDYRQPVAGQ